MDLTDSYTRVLPAHIRDRYEFIETRNAAAILSATNPQRFDELLTALHEFQLRTDDLVQPGGQETELAARLNTAFRNKGWREARVDTRIRLELRKMPHKPAGESHPTLEDTEVFNEGYKVDNFVDRLALDVEWNAKDGNLDRDLSAYRALYDAALIDVAECAAPNGSYSLSLRLVKPDRPPPVRSVRIRSRRPVMILCG